MNEFAKTGGMLGVAALLAVAAWGLGPREIKQDLFSDEGQDFFAAFTDPTTAVDMEVTEFSEEKASASKFAVHRDKDGLWTIPSHYGYPADAKDRVGKAAAMLIGLKKARAVSDRKDDHEAFGVIDPLDEGGETKGRGRRVVFKDSAGNVLADLIIGKELDGKLGVHYVRQPDKRRVYAVKLEGELSTKFSDWIETDLLKATSWDIDKVTFDNYSVDEQRQEVVPGEKLVVTKGADGKWVVDGMNAEAEEPNEETLRGIADSLTQIKIVGVRAKPDGLTAALEQASGFDRQILAQILAEKGYFLGRGGKLYSNEGDLLFETKKGVRYTLRFGELVPGEGDAVTSGAAAPTKPKAGEDGPQPVASNNRYLMVTAEFVESLLEKPGQPRLPKEQMDKRKQAREQIEKIVAAVDAYRAKNNGALPESLAKLTEKPAEGEAFLKELPKDPWDGDYALEKKDDAFVVISYGEDKKAGGDGVATDVRNDAFVLEDDMRKNADAWDAFDTKVTDGRKEAEKLTKRFGPWYYVIDQKLFEKLKPKRADLVKAKAPEAPKEQGK